MGIRGIIQKIIPTNVRETLSKIPIINKLNKWSNIHMINKLYGSSDDPQMIELLTYLSETGGEIIDGILIQQMMVFEYLNIDVNVAYDEQFGLPYVIHNNKKMFFPKEMSEEGIKAYYRSNLLEQDIRSAHCYFTDMSIYPKGGTYVDLGAAEGNFSLDLIDRAGHIYLFEGDEIWKKPLNATFKPYADKVTIINKYVTDEESDTTTTLKHYFGADNLVHVVKMDIEGAETTVIRDNKAFFNEHFETTLVACTYHLENDEAEIKRILDNYSFREQGWIMGSNRNELHPYVRRVLVFGQYNGK